MKILKIVLVLIALSLFIFACSQNPTTNTITTNNSATTGNANSAAQPKATVDELSNARRIYMGSCVNCHKEDGTGGVAEIEGKKIKVPDFTSDKLKKEPDAEFIEIIKNGEKGDGMPAFKDKLSEEDIKNLVKFIRRDFQGQ
jgi:mono/diheme cytochrome c family protein